MSSELVDTTEMYLRTFYELLEEGVELRRARIVERLHQSGPTVSQTVARMERDGLVVVESDRSISLTQEGHDVAQTVMRKHRLAECLLTQIIGLRPDLVHDEACRWDMATVSLVEKRAATGVYGEFTRKFSSALQRAPFLADPAVFQAEPGKLALPEAVSDVDTYAWAHNETSTGVVAPVRRPNDIDDNSLVLVDATSAAGGVAADMSTIDAYYFSPQKNLSSDGGLWLAILSPTAIERSNRVTSSARWVPQMLDLSLAVTNSRADQTLNTPALATLVMLEAQCRWLLDQGGMAWAASRTASTSGILYRWAEDNPLTTPFVADPALRSPVVVTIDIDESVDAARLCARARDNGILDIEPYRKLGRNQIRIATFSSIEPSDVEALTACLDWLLENRD